MQSATLGGSPWLRKARPGPARDRVRRVVSAVSLSPRTAPLQCGGVLASDRCRDEAKFSWMGLLTAICTYLYILSLFSSSRAAQTTAKQ